MAKPSFKISYVPLTLVVVVCAWVYYPSLMVPGPPLAFKIEGALDSKLNFRDAGASINECAHQKIMPEGLLLRSSGFFSGWSCDRVGNPNVIYSLNYSDAEHRRYYCRGDHGFNVGVTYQHQEFNDIEFVENWEKNPEQVRHVCEFLKDGISQFTSGKSSLFHCDAGRDRTGAVIALLAGWELEEKGKLSDQEIDAIECDYRKSKSLKPDKYGRIERLLKTLRSRGGVRVFLAERCGWNARATDQKRKN